MSLTDAARGAAYDLLFLNSAWANIGDASGLQPSAADGSFYLSLHATWPGQAGNQTTGEVSYTGYDREAVSRAAGGWTRSGNVMSNTADVLFDECTASPETAHFVGLGTDLTGTGNLVTSGVIVPSGGGAKGCGSSDASTDLITLATHGFSADDRVVVFETPGGGAGGGLAFGTVYYVITDGLTTEAFKVATTSEGTPINITADGSVRVVEVNPRLISIGTEPKFAASTLSFSVY